MTNKSCTNIRRGSEKLSILLYFCKLYFQPERTYVHSIFSLIVFSFFFQPPTTTLKIYTWKWAPPPTPPTPATTTVATAAAKLTVAAAAAPTTTMVAAAVVMMTIVAAAAAARTPTVCVFFLSLSFISQLIYLSIVTYSNGLVMRVLTSYKTL